MMKSCFLLPAVFLPFFTILFTGCNLEKEIQVPLPAYDGKLVVECYLEEGKPYRMGLTESVSYFEGPRLPIVNDAEVSISNGSNRIKLNYAVDVDTFYRKAYNYLSSSRVLPSPGFTYTLEVKDPKGRTITGNARFLPKVAIKSVEWKYNKDDFAFLLVKFDDNPSMTNYYRFQIHKDSLNKNADVDFNLDDSFNTNGEITLGTGYNYQKGDTVYVSLYHIEKSYYDFLETVSSAASANGNPFAQPAKVKSTVQGGLGVFATLVYDRKKIVLDQ
jgi:hypothetical protein